MTPAPNLNPWPRPCGEGGSASPEPHFFRRARLCGKTVTPTFAEDVSGTEAHHSPGGPNRSSSLRSRLLNAFIVVVRELVPRIRRYWGRDDAILSDLRYMAGA